MPPIVEATDTTEPIPSPQVAAEAAAAFDTPPTAATPIPPIETVAPKQLRNYTRIAAGVAAGALTLGAGFALGTAVNHEGRDGGQSVDGDSHGDHRGQGDHDGDSPGVPGSITPGRAGQMPPGQMHPGQGMPGRTCPARACRAVAARRPSRAAADPDGWARVPNGPHAAPSRATAAAPMILHDTGDTPAGAPCR